jgi:hypothetical protein
VNSVTVRISLTIVGEYAPIGGGLALLCQDFIAILSSALWFIVLAVNPKQARQPVFWICGAGILQLWPISFLLRTEAGFGSYSDLVWLGSVAIDAIATLVLIVFISRPTQK